MKRGDVVRVDLPRPQGPPGREQFGQRPAIVVQNESKKGLSTVLIVPFTSKLKAERFPGTIRLSPSAGNGLSEESVALVHQVRAVDRNRVRATLGALSNEELELVDQELRILLKL